MAFLATDVRCHIDSVVLFYFELGVSRLPFYFCAEEQGLYCIFHLLTSAPCHLEVQLSPCLLLKLFFQNNINISFSGVCLQRRTHNQTNKTCENLVVFDKRFVTKISNKQLLKRQIKG